MPKSKPETVILPAEPDEKQSFLDSAATQLFVAGWPQADIYTRAELLWKLRLAHIAKGNKP